MADKEISRLSRLTAILMQLQAKRMVTATEISGRFNISVRTVYRDIRALENAGVPVCTEDGKGYSLMEGYKIPPVMFTETEANALITAEQLILKNKDTSFIKNYSDAITKIKSVLRYSTRDKAELLSKRIYSGQYHIRDNTSNLLSSIQLALTNCSLARMEYFSPVKNETTARAVEPFALYNSAEENWLLIAWCRMRGDYRSFRLDRIRKFEILDEKFEPHQITIEEYFEKFKKIKE